MDVTTNFEDGRQLFAAVRAAALEHDRITRAIAQRRELAQHMGGGGFEPRVRSSKPDVNGTARSIAAMDYERRNEARLAEDRRLMDAACDILYGRDNRGGVAAYVGSAVADCAFLRCCGGMDWREVAEQAGVSVNTARAYVGVAADTVDMHGARFLATGEAWGDAT